MKPSAYLAALVRAHLAVNPPLAAKELAALKQSVVVLAGLGTLLAQTARNPALGGPGLEDVRQSISRTRAAVAVLEQGSSLPESCTERIAESARADSDNPRERASVANQLFSSADTRTVIEGSDNRAERQLMGSDRSAANADTPLSCPHSHSFPVHAAPAARVAC
jgi:hypothetical protein